ncbi:hypothetical protein D044_3871A, partial [Vibrio parahaemolyticus EKP-026]
MTVFV